MDRIRRHTLSVPVNIEAAIRDLGIALKKNAALAPGIAGQIKRLQNGGYEIATTNADHYFRQRFTMAHELGHYILHKSLIGDGVDDNIKYRSTVEGEFYNRSIDEYHERQANSFAASFLMPEAPLEGRVMSMDRPTLNEIAREFQVSPSAMRWRLKNLNLSAFVDGV